MIAIQSVFIAKENILFLEEWIDYHIQIGIDIFYLYDNSKVNKINYFDSVISPKKHMIPGKVNKYGIHFDSLVKLYDSDICKIMDTLSKKYTNIVNFIEWSPKDKDGFICYGQEEAYNNCLSKLKNTTIEWCASIDMDEFIVIDEKFDNNIKTYIKTLDSTVSCVKLSQVLFDSRFNYMDKHKHKYELITSINKACSVPLPPWHSNKYIYRICDALYLGVHDCKTKGKQINPSINDIRFNHYKILFDNNSSDFKLEDNKISDLIFNKIKENSKDYIRMTNQ